LVESSPTAWVTAHERFLSSMDTLMNEHVVLKSETFTANIACIRLFTCMHDRVTFELISILESRIAPWIVTFVHGTLFMIVFMFLESLDVSIDFTIVANVAI